MVVRPVSYEPVGGSGGLRDNEQSFEKNGLLWMCKRRLDMRWGPWSQPRSQNSCVGPGRSHSYFVGFPDSAPSCTLFRFDPRSGGLAWASLRRQAE